MCKSGLKGRKPAEVVARGSLNQVFCNLFGELKELGLVGDNERGRAYAAWRCLPIDRTSSVEALKSVLGCSA